MKGYPSPSETSYLVTALVSFLLPFLLKYNQRDSQVNTPQTTQPLRSPQWLERCPSLYILYYKAGTCTSMTSPTWTYVWKRYRERNQRSKSVDKKQSAKFQALDCRNTPKPSVKTGHLVSCTNLLCYAVLCWGGVYFLQRSPVFWICDQNSIGNTPMF